MPLPTDTVYLLVPLSAALALAFFLVRDLWTASRDDRSLISSRRGLRRPCQYCQWPGAFLAEERVQREGADVVAIRCFVCDRCGFPHWTVDRTAAAQRAL